MKIKDMKTHKTTLKRVAHILGQDALECEVELFSSRDDILRLPMDKQMEELCGDLFMAEFDIAVERYDPEFSANYVKEMEEFIKEKELHHRREMMELIGEKVAHQRGVDYHRKKNKNK